MTRLTRYIVTLSSGQALAIFAMAATLVWLVETLRFFDLLTVKGQGMFMLAGQAALVAIPLVRGILGACMGIGLARVLRDFQNSFELHAMHTGLRAGALLRAMLIFAIGGGLIVLITTSFFEPAARTTLRVWSTNMAADLVGRSLTPDRFTQVVPDVVMVIGGRNEDGTITDFFADDSRDPDVRRTYIAKTAVIVTDAQGYGLSLRDGIVQNVTREGGYSQVKFNRYQIGLDRLTEPHERSDSVRRMNSLTLIDKVVSGDKEAPSAVSELSDRLAASLRVVGFTLLVAAIFGFPTGRRGGRRMPVELLVLIMGFAESLTDQTISDMGGVGPYATTLAMGVLALVILAKKMGLAQRLWAQFGLRAKVRP